MFCISHATVSEQIISGMLAYDRGCTLQEAMLTIILKPLEKENSASYLCLLLQVRKHVNDLYEDLRDGHNLISLLEVLSGDTLVRLLITEQ